MAGSRPCPACGYENSVSAWVCNLCGAVLQYAPGHGRPVRKRVQFTDVLVLRRRNFVIGWFLAGSLIATYGLYISSFFLLFAHWRHLPWPQQLWSPATHQVTEWFLLVLFVTWSALLLGLIKADNVVTRLAGARAATHAEEQQIGNLIVEQAIAAGIPTPKLMIIHDKYPNALTAGIRKKRSAVLVTTGLLDLLSREETATVIGHECAHIKNGDVFVGTILAVLAGAIVVVRDFGFGLMTGLFRPARRSPGQGNIVLGEAALRLSVGAVLAITGTVFGLLAWASVFAVSRGRELTADMDSAIRNQNPGALADALQQIAEAEGEMVLYSAPFQHMYFVNPSLHRSSAGMALLRTHPPVEARIKLLRAMA